MTSRPPYRSPFWRPETAGGAANYFGRPTAAPAVPEQPQSRPVAPSPAPPRGYSSHDLAMFDQLMAFDRHAASAAPTLREPQRGLDPVRQAPARAAAPATSMFTSADLRAFEALQSGYGSTRSAVPGPRGANPSPRDHGYSPGDMKAFENLMKFDARQG